MLFAWSPWVGFGGKKELLEMYRIILKAFGICNMQYSSLDIIKIWTSFKVSRSLVQSVITLNDFARPKCKIFLSANSDNQYWLSTQHKLQRFSIRRHLFCCQQTQLQQTVKFFPISNVQHIMVKLKIIGEQL